jgi:hypothetical protein
MPTESSARVVVDGEVEETGTAGLRANNRISSVHLSFFKFVF